jgi:hypothetical protein
MGIMTYSQIVLVLQQKGAQFPTFLRHDGLYTSNIEKAEKFHTEFKAEQKIQALGLSDFEIKFVKITTTYEM